MGQAAITDFKKQYNRKPSSSFEFELFKKLRIAQLFNTDHNKEFTRKLAVGESVRVKRGS